MGWDKDIVIRQQRENTNTTNNTNNDSNNANNEYTKQTIYGTIFSLHDDWFAASPQAVIMEPQTHRYLQISQKILKKDWTPGKVWIPGQERIWINGNEKAGFLPSGQPPFINWAWCPWYGIFPLACLGLLPGCAPSQLLHTCSLAQYEKLMSLIS